MKKNLFFAILIAGFIFSSCSKDDPAPADHTGNIILRYDFTAEIPGNYNLTYTADTAIHYETTSAQSWTKTITVTKGNSSKTDSASFTVLPPPEWVATSMQTNATVKIYVNGTEKASNSAIIGGYDRPAGLTAIATY